MMSNAERELYELLRGSVEVLGYELLGVEYRPGRGALLRLYIDSPEGISVDDCERVSHQVSGVLDVEDPIPGHYNLEVSSPGLDRPLFFPEHFRAHVGQRVRLRLAEAIEGPEGARRRIRGILREVTDEGVEIQAPDGEQPADLDGARLWIPFASIARARLEPESIPPGSAGT